MSRNSRNCHRFRVKLGKTRLAVGLYGQGHRVSVWKPEIGRMLMWSSCSSWIADRGGLKGNVWWPYNPGYLDGKKLKSSSKQGTLCASSSSVHKTGDRKLESCGHLYLWNVAFGDSIWSATTGSNAGPTLLKGWGCSLSMKTFSLLLVCRYFFLSVTN